MPITKSAQKALRQTKRKTEINKKIKLRMKDAVDTFNKVLDQATLSKAYQTIDRAVKRNLLHQNKAAHLKSALSKKANLGQLKPTKPSAAKTTTKKPATKKPAAKKPTTKKAASTKTTKK
jgi:ribosomal protein S20